jgi:hypothetical protein
MSQQAEFSQTEIKELLIKKKEKKQEKDKIEVLQLLEALERFYLEPQKSSSPDIFY